MYPIDPRTSPSPYSPQSPADSLDEELWFSLFCVVMVLLVLLFYICGRRIFLVDVLTSIPLVVLICKVLAIGLPARLSSGGLSRWVSFVLFVWFTGFVLSIASAARSFLYLETMNAWYKKKKKKKKKRHEFGFFTQPSIFFPTLYFQI